MKTLLNYLQCVLGVLRKLLLYLQMTLSALVIVLMMFTHTRGKNSTHFIFHLVLCLTPVTVLYHAATGMNLGNSTVKI